MEQIRSADVLANFPQVDEEKLNAALAAEAAASNRKIIVLDDDPTGVQTVHDIYVYTDWTVESLRKGFAAPEKLFFILTNSRGFTVAETTKAHREIAENTAKVAREFGMDYLIISRGDSTLRGHYPLETDLSSVTVFTDQSVLGEIEAKRLFFNEAPLAGWASHPGNRGAVFIHNDERVENINI